MDRISSTNDTVTVGGDKFAKKEGATYNVTGMQIEKGMELLDDELGYYMDCMAGCRCFICSIAWCGENGVKEWQ